MPGSESEYWQVGGDSVGHEVCEMVKAWATVRSAVDHVHSFKYSEAVRVTFLCLQ